MRKQAIRNITISDTELVRGRYHATISFENRNGKSTLHCWGDSPELLSQMIANTLSKLEFGR